jgi:fatty acid amide hydrolase
METITNRQTTNHQDLTGLPAVELAAMIARGDISSLEVVEAHIERIERVNPRLNAVVVTRYDAARTEARKANCSGRCMAFLLP